MRDIRAIEEDTASKIVGSTSVLMIGLLVFFGGIFFLVYAYWRLFTHVQVSAVAVAASLIFTVVNVLRAALLMIDELRITHAERVGVGSDSAA